MKKGLIGKGMDPAAQPEVHNADVESQDEVVLEGDSELELDESDPGFQQALQFAMDALYKGGAAKNIAEQLRASSGNVAEGIANVAYEIVSITEERTEGAVDEELLLLFVTYIVEEVIDIGQAAGVKIMPSDIAQAVKQMTLRWLGENGFDTRELQSAMDKFDVRAMDSLESSETPAGNGAPPAAAAAAAEEP